MFMAQLNHEPSMEDILASIKRIIAEDSEAPPPRTVRPIRRDSAVPAGQAFAHKLMSVMPDPEPVPPQADAIGADVLAQGESADVLELTSPIAEEAAPVSPPMPVEAVSPPAPVLASPAPPPPPPQPVAAEPIAAVEPKAEPKIAKSQPAKAPPADAESASPDIVVPQSAPLPKEPVAAMDRLMSDPAAQASRSAFAALTQLQVRAEAGQENTLEGLVADMLRPMLREWLDRELPAMVERLVTEEIARVSGRN